MMLKKIVSAIAFVMIAVISGSIVSIYRIDRGFVEAMNAAQPEIVDTVQAENEYMAQTENQSKVPSDIMTFSCPVFGCTQTEIHQHGLCEIGGCTLIGEHSHSRYNIVECTETGPHMHNGEYCYLHSSDNGHAYHNCGVAGCTVETAHAHFSNSQILNEYGQLLNGSEAIA